jgi:hypothetical protein
VSGPGDRELEALERDFEEAETDEERRSINRAMSEIGRELEEQDDRAAAAWREGYHE